jgi:two-component system, OmpR family, response regulator CpxR
MRPKRVVLCVAESEQTLSVQVFRFETWEYRAIRAACVDEAMSILKRALPESIDLLIVHQQNLHGFDDLLAAAKQLQPEIKIVVFSDKPVYFGNSTADIFIPKGNFAWTDLRQQIRTLIAKKRGPKKAVASVPAPQEVARYG